VEAEGVAHGDAGAGLLSMAFGMLVFFTLLLFSVHTILYLHVRSTAAHAALVGANRLAGAGVNAFSPQVEQDAQAQIARMLGPDVRSWREAPPTAGDTDYVTFTVSIDAGRITRAPWLGSAAGSGWSAQPG
jgi:hypothetical protein